jgi:hypothetical protein
MAIEAIHSFLVYPSKNVDKQPDIGGTTVALSGKLFDMLSDVYAKSESECRIDIAFTPAANGKQQNDARDLLLAYVQLPSLETGRDIAKRLQIMTDKRPGLGLLFLMLGKEDSKYKVIVSRFPADNGILAETKQGALTVAFLERIFMKSAVSYKSAVYVDASLKTGFWDGRCVDKQVNSNVVTISDYWIKSFLASDFKTTPAQGTRRLAIALRKAQREAPDLKAKEEIGAAARLVSGLNGKTISAESLVKKYAFSPSAEAVFKKQFPGNLYKEQFRVDNVEYAKHIAFQSIELSNGGIMTADATRFDEVFKRELLDGRVRFSTEGEIVAERLRKTKL